MATNAGIAGLVRLSLRLKTHRDPIAQASRSGMHWSARSSARALRRFWLCRMRDGVLRGGCSDVGKKELRAAWSRAPSSDGGSRAAALRRCSCKSPARCDVLSRCQRPRCRSPGTGGTMRERRRPKNYHLLTKPDIVRIWVSFFLARCGSLIFPDFPLLKIRFEWYATAMKILTLIVAVLTLNSCNTLIGMGRDTKVGFQWTRSKIQGNGQQDPYGAPTY